MIPPIGGGGAIAFTAPDGDQPRSSTDLRGFSPPPTPYAPATAAWVPSDLAGRIEAASLSEEVVSLRREIHSVLEAELGPHHEDTYWAGLDLARVLRACGREDEADALEADQRGAP